MRRAFGSGVRSLAFIISFASAGCGLFGKQAVDQVRGDFPCPGPLVEESIANETRKVSGCGVENFYGWDIDSGKWRSVKERASFDMGCPSDKLTAHHLGSNTVGVEGCDKKAVYVSTALCGGGACSWKGWVLNSEVK